MFLNLKLVSNSDESLLEDSGLNSSFFFTPITGFNQKQLNLGHNFHSAFKLNKQHNTLQNRGEDNNQGSGYKNKQTERQTSEAETALSGSALEIVNSYRSAGPGGMKVRNKSTLV